MSRVLLSYLIFMLTACVARPSAIEPIRSGYQLNAGDVLRLRVESRLLVDSTGSHPAFLVNGNTEPLAWDLDGEFDNVILDVDGSGDAQVERWVRTIRSSGHHEDEKFGLSWSRDKDGAAPEEGGEKNSIDRFVANMISLPLRIRVTVQGVSSAEEPAFLRIVMRRGMMFWPMRFGEATWPSNEVFAVPLLHEKVQLNFVNSITKRTGAVAHIAASASIKEMAQGLSGHAVVTAEFDESCGRLRKLMLELRVLCSRKAPVPAGGDGDVRLDVTYRETQVLIE